MPHRDKWDKYTIGRKENKCTIGRKLDKYRSVVVGTVRVLLRY